MEKQKISDLAVFEICQSALVNNQIVKSYRYELGKSTDYFFSNIDAAKILDFDEQTDFLLISKQVCATIQLPDKYQPDSVNIVFDQNNLHEAGQGKRIDSIRNIKLDEKSIENGLKRAVNILNQLEKLTFDEYKALYLK